MNVVIAKSEKRLDLNNILFAIAIICYSFDGYLFYISGLLYLCLVLLSALNGLNVGKYKGMHLYIIIYIILFPILNWYIHMHSNINNQEIKNLFGVILVLSFMLTATFNERTLEDIFSILFVMGMFEAVYVILEYLFPGFFLNLYGIFFPLRLKPATESMALGYVYGFTNQVANTAYLIVMSIGCVFYDSKINKKKKYFLVTILFLALLLTGKRGHLVFCCLALALVFFFSNNNKIKTSTWLRIFFGVVMIFLCILVLYYTNIGIGERIVDTINGLLQGENITTSRDKINILSYSIIRENWLTGIGWGKYKYEYQKYWYVLSNGTWNQTYNAHNTYLQLLCEVGIVGFIIFLILAINGVVHGYRLIHRLDTFGERTKKYIRLSCFIQFFFLLYCFTGNPLYEFNLYSIYFIAIVVNKNMVSRGSINVATHVV